MNETQPCRTGSATLARPHRTGWSAGYFSTAGCQIPQACLEHCLSGDPGRAVTDGCPFLQHLAARFSDAQDSQGDGTSRLPGTILCPEGYEVSTQPDPSGCERITLVLHPPLSRADDEGIARSAIDALHVAMRDHWHLNQENEGLANEVLQCYEQVNLIFDISGQVTALSNEADVRRVLLEKLQVIYDADQVLCIDEEANTVLEVNQDGRFTRVEGDFFLPGLMQVNGEQTGVPSQTRSLDEVQLPSETTEAIRQLHASPRSYVTSDNSVDLRKSGHGTSLWGPLRHAQDRFATIGIIRRGRCFEAGDMLLLDSALTFGSHILGNLRLIEQLKRASFESVRALANAIDQKDPYTSGHSERVGFLARVVGQRMKLSPGQLRELEWGGLLHDIGKIGMPDLVLNKAGKLTDEEFALIKNHPARGHAVLTPVASLAGVLDVVLYHHERPDGRGYPTGLSGDRIPLLARIVHVVDTFDALTSTRSYRRAYSHTRALEIMKNDRGTKLDADVLDAFLVTLERLPQDYPEPYDRWFARHGQAE